MSFSITSSDLSSLVSMALPFVPSKSSLQILMNFRLSFLDGALFLSATDVEHSVRLEKRVSGSESFEISINARKFSEIVNALPNGDISINLNGNVLEIIHENGFFCKIAGTDVHDFPEFPEIEEKKDYFFPVSCIKEMIEKSCFAVSKDESRGALRGVLWTIDSEKSGMVATDGHRLGSCFFRGIISSEEKRKSIFFPKSLVHLLNILSNFPDDETIMVSFSDNYAVFSNSFFVLYTKLIEGQYPDYEKAIPKNNSKTAIIEKGFLVDAVKRVSILSSQKTNLIKCYFKENQLEISALNKDIGGEAKESIAITYQGDDHIIGFNSNYFKEILSIISTNFVKIEMSNQISGCLLFPYSDEKKSEIKSEELFLIMPLRILEDN